MAANHALRGAASAWLGLIALRAVGIAGGSGRITSFFSDVDGLVTRALSSTVPAIPDRRTSGTGGSTATSIGLSAAQARAGARAGAATGAVAAVTAPGGLLSNLPNLQAYASMPPGSLAGLANNPALK